MKNWSLAILMGAAVLSLQGCDVTIHDSPNAQGASTSESTPAAAATPDTGTTIASSAPQQPAGTAPGAEMPAADTRAAASGAEAPTSEAPTSEVPTAEAPAAAASAPTDSMATSPPQTNAMGAPAAGSSSDTTAMPADTSTDGVAAPTELARFFQQNPIRASAGGAEPGKGAAANSGAAKAGGKSGNTKS